MKQSFYSALFYHWLFYNQLFKIIQPVTDLIRGIVLNFRAHISKLKKKKSNVMLRN